MNNIILIRFNEIHLKGGNKKYFTRLLYNNIKYALRNIECKIENIQNRLLVRDYQNEDEIIDILRSVFGIHSISRAVELDNNVEMINEYVSKLTIENTFKCDVNRAEKSFPIKSNEYEADLGEIILKNNEKAKVDVHKPETIVHVDIRENGKTYIFKDIIYAYSGLPLGEYRDGLLLLSGGIDSPVAGFCMAKRGLRQDMLHFDSYPYTSPQAKDKVITLARTVAKFNGARFLYVCSMTKMQEAFHINCKPEYAINLLRRAMVRVANAICDKYNYKTIITGESLGQVASQTIESLSNTDGVSEHLIVRPLISFNKEEIIAIAKDIDTYETSILPYEDCCTVFLPQNPVIKPIKAISEKEEARVIDYAELLKSVIENIEVIDLSK